LLYTPEGQIDGSGEYTFLLSSKVDGYFVADGMYSGIYFRTYSQGVTGYQPLVRDGEASFSANLRGGVRFEAVDVSLFIKNLTNNQVPPSKIAGTVPNTLGYNSIRVESPLPRSLGVTLNVRF
jgi:hypothetical protein